VKLRKQKSPNPVPAEPAAKARLRNVGNGTLELVNNTIKFQVEKGKLKKQKEIAKEIPIADIESIERAGNELSVTWKGTTDRFVMEKAETAETLHARLIEALHPPIPITTLETKEEPPKQKPNELVQTLANALKVTDSLFDILRCLHGRVDWNHVESHLGGYKENARRFADQTGGVSFDFARLSSAVKDHLPEEISKETYNSLRVLFEHFNGLTSPGESSAQIHPNNDDARKVIAAYYTLNDIILGTVVGDDEVGKETNELVGVLDDLSKGAGLKINVDGFKDVVKRLGAESAKESLVEESRGTFVQQLKDLLSV